MKCTNKDCEAYNEDYVGNCGDDWIENIFYCSEADIEDDADQTE